MKRIRISICLLVFFCLTVITILAPPLFRSSAYKVSFSYNGASRSDAILYKPVLTSKLYYIRLPMDEGRAFSWFGVNFDQKTVFIPAGINNLFGLPYVHRDQNHGVNILSQKAGAWVVDFSDNSVVFSGEGMEIQVQK